MGMIFNLLNRLFLLMKEKALCISHSPLHTFTESKSSVAAQELLHQTQRERLSYTSLRQPHHPGVGDTGTERGQAGSRAAPLPRAEEGFSSLLHLPPCHITAPRPCPHQPSTIHKELRSPRTCLKEDVKHSAENTRGRKRREDIAKTSSNLGCRTTGCAKSPDTPRASRMPRAGSLLLPEPA